jgi:hypothetical protein
MNYAQTNGVSMCFAFYFNNASCVKPTMTRAICGELDSSKHPSQEEALPR